jgi:hypothetical protein
MLPHTCEKSRKTTKRHWHARDTRLKLFDRLITRLTRSVIDSGPTFAALDNGIEPQFFQFGYFLV